VLLRLPRDTGIKLVKKLALAASALIISAASASAADMAPRTYTKAPAVPAPEIMSWNGFYVGINGGYGWSPFNNQLADPPFALSGSSPSGGFGGGQIGYSWQMSNLVLGVETDLQGGNIGSKKFDTAGNGYFTQSTLNWFGTVRGRVGYAVSNVLFYGTGGFAYGGIHNRVDYSSLFPGDVYDISRTTSGYVVGAGMEYKLTRAWSVKAEYQYINLGFNDPSRPGFGTYGGTQAPFGTVIRRDAFNTVRVGINYAIGAGPVVAKY
jgi:outer membrane immunogenic protein